MSTPRALALCLAAFLCVTLGSLGAVVAQDYPSRPITMVVAFPPGGVDDTIARMIHPALEKALNQTIVVENVGGAGGMIAAAKAARADHDGYTILLHQDALAAGMSLYKDLTFDAVKDFTPIGLVNTAPTTLAARPNLPANNFDEFVKWAKQTGAGVKLGHPGVGSFGHLAAALICQELGLTVTQVPYRGAGPALVDLLAGQVDISIIGGVVAAPLVKAGKLKAYAIIGQQPFAAMPELKTFGQLGYKKLDIDFWHMMLVPTGTPRPIVDRLNQALRATLADPKVKALFAQGGMAEYPDDQMTPEAASDLLKREVKLWGDVIKANHITAGG
ncbi:MAG TPA: tripartite tricarboxylate transporter substrate binding protein [Xanthobacteraceae bacterium]|jgi:tripartite-type tricarboxylate transporter receptor subunit TctC